MQHFKTFYHSLFLTPLVVSLAISSGRATEVIQSNLATNQPLGTRDALTFELDQLPTPTEGQLALFIGKTDVTTLINIEGNRLIYKPSLLPLPNGKSYATLYLITPEATRRPIAQFLLVVEDQLAATSPTVSEFRGSSPIQLNLPFTDVSPSLFNQSPNEAPSLTTDNPTLSETDETTPVPEEKDPTLEIDEANISQQSKSSSTRKEPVIETAESNNSNSSEDTNTSSTAELTETPNSQTSETSFVSEETTDERDVSLKSRFNISTNSQLLESTSGDAQPSDRPVFIDTKLEAGFDLKAKKGIWELNATANFLGVTNPEEALRFGKLGNQAPRFDLSDYIIESTIGPVTLSLGDQCYGNHPLLIDNFCSRGVV